MFIKPSIAEGRRQKCLETGRSLEIHLESGQRIDGIIDFISEFQGAATIFIDGGHNIRLLLKVYSNRTLIELVAYTAGSIRVHKVSKVTVMSQGVQEPVSFAGDKITHYHSEKTKVMVPVVVGDEFFKAGHLFKVLAITKDGSNMFLESEHGKAVTVNLNDKSLINAFSGFEWGNPTR